MLQQQIYITIKDTQTGKFGEVTITVDLDKVASHEEFRRAMLHHLRNSVDFAAGAAPRFEHLHSCASEPRVIDPVFPESSESSNGGGPR